MNWYTPLVFAILCAPCASEAALTLTVDSYSSTLITMTISGTFDADVGGNYKSYLAIKNDWSNNIGTHTEWFYNVDSMDSNIEIDGVAAVPGFSNIGSTTSADSVTFINDENYNLAGMTVSGSFTLYGTFRPFESLNLQLVSGYDLSPIFDWNRLEATATMTSVPEPSESAAIGGIAALGLIALLRRKKQV